jgi:hypothetical protein
MSIYFGLYCFGTDMAKLIGSFRLPVTPEAPPKMYILYLFHSGSRGSSVSIVSDYGMDDRDLIPNRGRTIFLLASASRPALGPTQPLIQWVPGGPFPGGKARPGLDADHSPPYSAEVKYE